MGAKKGEPKPRSEMNCSFCGALFLGVAKSQYCTTSCGHAAAFRRNMEQPEWRLSRLMSMAKNRSKTKNLSFNLDIEYIMELWEENLGCCALTGQLFDLTSWGEKGQVNPQAPSIDRIVPKKGYTKGNVRLITYHMNISLSDFGIEEFETLIKSYLGNI